MIIRELINLIGFRVSEAQWNAAEAKVTALQRRMQGLGQRMTFMFTLPFGFLGAKIAGTLSTFEQMNVAFETMVGNAEEADQLVTNMLEFAAKTPFEIKEIGPTVKQLLAMGSSADIVLDELQMLGNIAAGLSVPISRLALNFGQVRAQARLTGREVRDFAVAGVPLLAELAKMLNTTEGAVKEMVSKGTIGFDQVKEAFRRMSSEGGRFANLMIKQSKTLGGMWSNFLDVITLSIRSLETTLLPVLKRILMLVIDIFSFLDRNISPTMKTIIFFGFALLAVIGPLLLAFSGIISLGKFVASAFGTLAVMAGKAGVSVVFLLGKFLLIAAAVVAVAAIIAAFIEDLVIYMRGGDSLIGQFLEPWETLAPKIQAAIQPFLEHLRNMWVFIQEIFWSIASLIHRILTDDIDGAVTEVENIIKNLLLFFGAFLSILGPLVWRALQVLWKVVYNFLEMLDKMIVNSLKVLAKLIGEQVIRLLSFLTPLVTGWIADIVMKIIEPIEGLFQKIKRLGQKVGLFRDTAGSDVFGASTGSIVGNPNSPALALAGTGGGGGVARSVSVNAEINANVPAGTDQDIIDETKRQAEEAAAKVFTKEISDVLRFNMEDE